MLEVIVIDTRTAGDTHIDILEKGLSAGVWEIIDVNTDSIVSPKYWSRIVRAGGLYHLDTKDIDTNSPRAIAIKENTYTPSLFDKSFGRSSPSSSLCSSHTDLSLTTEKSSLVEDSSKMLSLSRRTDHAGAYRSYPQVSNGRESYYATLSRSDPTLTFSAWLELYGYLCSASFSNSNALLTKPFKESGASESSRTSTRSNCNENISNIVFIAFYNVKLPMPFPLELDATRRCSFSLTTQLWRATRALAKGSNSRHRMYHINIQKDIYNRTIMYKGKAITGDGAQTLGSLGFSAEVKEYFVLLLKE